MLSFEGTTTTSFSLPPLIQVNWVKISRLVLYDTVDDVVDGSIDVLEVLMEGVDGVVILSIMAGCPYYE